MATESAWVYSTFQRILTFRTRRSRFVPIGVAPTVHGLPLIASATQLVKPRRTGYFASSGSNDERNERYKTVCIWCIKRSPLTGQQHSIHSMQTQRVAFASPSAHASVSPLCTSRFRTHPRNIMKSHADCTLLESRAPCAQRHQLLSIQRRDQASHTSLTLKEAILGYI